MRRFREDVTSPDTVSLPSSLRTARRRTTAARRGRSAHLSFQGTPENPRWLDDLATKRLLDVAPSGNLPVALVKGQLQHLLAGLEQLNPHIERAAKARADELLGAHTRVRKATRMAGRVRVEPVLPADILGCFILLKDGE